MRSCHPADHEQVSPWTWASEGLLHEQDIEIKKTTLQSGNDVVLALANNNGDIGYLGFVPMYIASTSGIPLVWWRRVRSKGLG